MIKTMLSYLKLTYGAKYNRTTKPRISAPNQPSDVIQHYVEGNAESHNKHADDGCKDVLRLRLVWFLGLSCLQSLAIKFEKRLNTSLGL